MSKLEFQDYFYRGDPNLKIYQQVTDSLDQVVSYRKFYLDGQLYSSMQQALKGGQHR